VFVVAVGVRRREIEQLVACTLTAESIGKRELVGRIGRDVLTAVNGGNDAFARREWVHHVNSLILASLIAISTACRHYACGGSSTAAAAMARFLSGRQTSVIRCSGRGFRWQNMAARSGQTASPTRVESKPAGDAIAPGRAPGQHDERPKPDRAIDGVVVPEEKGRRRPRAHRGGPAPGRQSAVLTISHAATAMTSTLG
jgi:hypothetical protein